MTQTVLVTGVAGFIGMHTAISLIRSGFQVIGVDNLNDYYPVQLKRARLSEISREESAEHFEFHETSIDDSNAMNALADRVKPAAIVHLAAQAGVRYSLENPMAYAQSNLIGMTVMLELARHHQVNHFVYASSSSVYGGSKETPYSEQQRVDSPVSFYAATKMANEMMAASYAHLYQVPATGLRFFTVYGPWGRPDMAPWLFTDAILQGKTINVFGNGAPLRDYTYIDDIVAGICRVLESPPNSTSGRPARVLNIGNGTPISVMQFIQTLEEITGKKAKLKMLPMQPGDVDVTHANISAINELTGFSPNTDCIDGMRKFVDWFRNYHN